MLIYIYILIIIYIYTGENMPFPIRLLGSVAKSILPWASFGAVAGATEHFLSGSGEHRRTPRTIKGEVILDENGNVVGIKRIRKKRVKRYPKYVYEALKGQAELTKSFAEFVKMMMFKEIAQKED